MRYRAGVVTTLVLAGVVLLFWNPFARSPVIQAPVLPPPALSHPTPGLLTGDSFGTADALPRELDDESFWKMISEFSEPGGYFMYENFLSNENSYQNPIGQLTKIVKPGGVYLGVGPEQNFTYISALGPRMAFIIDIRRQNMLELLMYKALFAVTVRMDSVKSRPPANCSKHMEEQSRTDSFSRAICSALKSISLSAVSFRSRPRS